MFRDGAEVARKAHELIGRYGAAKAAVHAHRIADAASKEGKTEEHSFWNAVAEMLKPMSPYPK
ncbi:MAG: hypothetical protein JO314_03225 [Acidobacteria bacterium]|nr:hypothetical protein [Acidobacteriota bacterium]